MRENEDHMFGTLKSLVSLAVVACVLVFAGLAEAAAAQSDIDGKRSIKNFLTENTLVYADEKGEENLIHFSRFGSFDWYFPCQFESGLWSLGQDLILSLTYDNPDFQPREFQLVRQQDEITLTEVNSGNTGPAKLLEGSHIPFF